MLVPLRSPNLTLCYAKEKRVGVRVRLTTFVHLFTEYPMESDGQMEVEQVDFGDSLCPETSGHLRLE